MYVDAGQCTMTQEQLKYTLPFRHADNRCDNVYMHGYRHSSYCWHVNCMHVASYVAIVTSLAMLLLSIANYKFHACNTDQKMCAYKVL